MIKVLIADDQELMRQSLQIILGMEKDIEVMGAVENGLEVKEEIVPISARLIANKVGYKFKNERLRQLCRALEEQRKG